MSQPVSELLSLSKAGLKSADIKRMPVNLLEGVRRVTGREACEQAEFAIDVPPALMALAEPDLMARALGNVLRNAIRHAADDGPITPDGTGRE